MNLFIKFLLEFPFVEITYVPRQGRELMQEKSLPLMLILRIGPHPYPYRPCLSPTLDLGVFESFNTKRKTLIQHARKSRVRRKNEHKYTTDVYESTTYIYSFLLKSQTIKPSFLILTSLFIFHYIGSILYKFAGSKLCGFRVVPRRKTH